MALNNRKSYTLTWLQAIKLPPAKQAAMALAPSSPTAHAHLVLWCGRRGGWRAFPAHDLSKRFLCSSQQTQCIKLSWWPVTILLLILNLLLDLCCVSSISVWKNLAKFISHLHESAASHSHPCMLWNSFCWAVCLLAVLLGRKNPHLNRQF